jgi:hypothetical protein
VSETWVYPQAVAILMGNMIMVLEISYFGKSMSTMPYQYPGKPLTGGIVEGVSRHNLGVAKKKTSSLLNLFEGSLKRGWQAESAIQVIHGHRICCGSTFW